MDMLERIERLERETADLKRRAKAWQAAALSILVVGLIASCKRNPTPATAQTQSAAAQPQTQKEVRTEMLMIMSPEGQLRGLFGNSEKGTSLVFMDPAGKQRMTLSLVNDGPAMLTMQDAKEKPRLSVGLSEKGEPIVSTFDAAGEETDLTE